MKIEAPALPFLDRMGVVFVLTALCAVAASLLTAPRPDADRIETGGGHATRAVFNVGAVAVLLALVALYATWW